MTFILSPSFFLKLKKSCLKFYPRKMNIYVLGTGTGIATKQPKIDANRHLIVDVSINEEFTLQYLIAFCATVKFNSRCKVFNKDLTGLNSATGSEKESERLTSINKLVKITSICRAQLCEYHYIARSCLNASLCICSDTFGKTTFYWFWNAFLYHWRDKISKCQMWTQNVSAFVVNSPATAYRQQRLYYILYDVIITWGRESAASKECAKQTDKRQSNGTHQIHFTFVFRLRWKQTHILISWLTYVFA